jgi:hypothetical protein
VIGFPGGCGVRRVSSQSPSAIERAERHAENSVPGETAAAGPAGTDKAAARGIDQDQTRQLLWVINSPPKLSDPADIPTDKPKIRACESEGLPGH